MTWLVLVLVGSDFPLTMKIRITRLTIYNDTVLYIERTTRIVYRNALHGGCVHVQSTNTITV